MGTLMPKNAKRKSVANGTSASKRRTETAGPNVKYTRDELNNLLIVYYMIRDCIEGEPAIKGMVGTRYYGSAEQGNGSGSAELGLNFVTARAMRYLPMPNPEDQSAENRQRYQSYVQRAVFYNVTSRTLDGMAGQIFLREPVLEVPDLMKPMLLDADGGGLNMTQLAMRAVRNVLPYGRSGLLVDYPKRDQPTSVSDIQSGAVLPTMTVYHPWDIINWRVSKVGAKRVLSLIVLRETQDEEGDDGFELSTYEQYRALRLDENGDYIIQLFSASDNSYVQDDMFKPLDAKGQPLKYIPFTFIGSENNDCAVDKPPFYDLASLDIAHYRNSADYEEACFLTGQPTPVASGLTAEWVENVLHGAITLGSRTCIPLPVGADAKLLQATANTMPIEAMRQKEEQMVAIGAKLVQKQRTTRASATEVIVETTSESSVLSNVSKNVSAAIEWGLKVAADFIGATKDQIRCKLNTDFDLTKMTPEGIAMTLKVWQAGGMAFEEMRETLRRNELATLDDAEAKAKIDEEQAASLAAAAAAMPNDPGPGKAAGTGAGA